MFVCSFLCLGQKLKTEKIDFRQFLTHFLMVLTQIYTLWQSIYKITTGKSEKVDVCVKLAKFNRLIVKNSKTPSFKFKVKCRSSEFSNKMLQIVAQDLAKGDIIILGIFMFFIYTSMRDL